MDTRNVSRRRLLRGLGMGAGLTLLAPILAACGQSSGSGTAPAAPAKPDDTKPAAPAAAPAKPATEAKPGEQKPAAAATAAAPVVTAGSGDQPIVVWSGQITFTDQATPVGKWATWVRDTFAQKNPKYTLKVEDHGWDQALRTSLLTAIAGGTVPEVTTGEAFVHEFASLGALQAVPDVSEKDFAYGTIAGSLYQGKLWGLPIYTSAFALETNARVAKKAGLDPNAAPKTWDELIANSTKAFEAGKGEYIGYNLYGPAPNRVYGTVLRTIPWINQTGKPLGDDDGTKAFFNSPEHVAAYEFSRKLFKTADPGNTFSGDEGKLYAYNWQDKGLYQIAQMSLAQNAKDAGAETVYHPLPRKDPNVSGNVVLANIVFSPLAKAKNSDGAIAFVKFMAEKETQQQLGEILGFRLPARLDLLNDPNLEKLAGYQRFGPQIVRTYADILSKEDVKPVPPYSKNPDKIWIAWGDVFGKVLENNDPVQPMLDSLQQEVERLLR
jgi:multiple sugar transport system substrate-binding protein